MPRTVSEPRNRMMVLETIILFLRAPSSLCPRVGRLSTTATITAPEKSCGRRKAPPLTRGLRANRPRY